MFKIVVLDGTQKIPDDNICYIVAKGGVYLKKKVGLIESLTPIKNISILKDVSTYATIKIPKISGKDFGQVMTFFKKVYKEYKSEAIVMLYYNDKEKKFKIHIPHQKVSSGGLDYVKSTSIKNYIQIGTIHSHADFSAFHSSIDDSDEKTFDGIHITIGNNMDQFPSISASIVVNSSRFIINPVDYVENLDVVEYTPYFHNMFRPAFREINGNRKYLNTVKTKTGYQLNVSAEDKEIPESWMDFVDGEKVSQRKYFGTYSYNSDWINDLLGSRTDLENFYIDVKKGENKKNTIKSKSKVDPCSGCAFKNHKLKSVEKFPCKDKKEIDEKDNQEGFSCLESIDRYNYDIFKE